MILFNKPYRVLCQFSDSDGRSTLADFVRAPAVYPAGRLDYDSEGLVVLTDDGALQASVSQPQLMHSKHYWVQVDGTADAAQIKRLIDGVELKDGWANAITAKLVTEPEHLWSRSPPIRVRQSIPTSWLQVAISEGRNRQVRRMTAAVGLPALRLIRHRIGPWSIAGLTPGQSAVVDNATAWKQLRG